ncbi:hypothetical protein TD95_004629 [Thielaviopsis punctulata]|uniref:Uncharacterized protein n=1 Tax=Thielaviopsis punctulata TaxID=72032 RepID=A0A0F4ZC73_9PEZI|nr:hypothetical protein TD95_004629 [Thielaviopsis punctulata]
MSFQNLVVVITGGAGGLGKALAVSFLEVGSRVAICDVNDERLSAVSSEWASAYPDKALAVKTDITDEESVDKFFSQISSTFGRIDMLVNNAGLVDNFDPVGTLKKSVFENIMAVNVTGTYLCSKAAINIMLEQAPSGGTIINIGSVASIRGTAVGAAYVASKHAVVGLTKNTAAFYGSKGIYSLAFLMGGMQTNINEAFTKGFNEEGMTLMKASNPGSDNLDMMVPLEDVTKYCKFFADPNMAKASNGSSVTINRNWPVA